MKHNLSVRILHAILAFLIIAQLILGFGFSYNILNFKWVMVLHKSFGLTTFFIILGLIITRIFSYKPKYDPPLPIIQLIIAKCVHFGMYISAFGMAVSGLGGAILVNHPWKIFFIIPFPEIFKTNIPLGREIFSYHYVFATILLVLVVIHIIAALFHQFILKDNIIARIK